MDKDEALRVADIAEAHYRSHPANTALTTLAAEVRRLEKRVAALEIARDVTKAASETWCQTAEAAEAEARRLREALGWYAEDDNYQAFEVGYGDFWGAREGDMAFAVATHENWCDDPAGVAKAALAEEQDNDT